jgi:hypothetical protein
MNLASTFYTNVVEHKGKLLIRGVANGQSYLSRINYSPKLYLPTKEESKYKTLDGTNLKSKRFDSISKAKHFYSEYNGFDVGTRMRRRATGVAQTPKTGHPKRRRYGRSHSRCLI